MESPNKIDRNTPASSLIKNFINKKSGKVTESRNEIYTRFDCLDWKHQKKILSAFLDSSKTDRRWAYSKLIWCWDKSFEARLKELWENDHEEKCSWIIIRKFPIKYIIQNLDKFTDKGDYYRICLRLAKRKGFFIDKNKLSPVEYLSVACHAGLTIPAEEAKDLLYKIVHNYCIERNLTARIVLDEYALRNHTIISPKQFKDVERAINYLDKLGHSNVIWKFLKWDKNVQTIISMSPEFKSEIRRITDGGMSSYSMLNIAYDYSYLALEDKYRLPTDPKVETMLEPQDFDWIHNEREIDIRAIKIDESSIAQSNSFDDHCPF